QLTGFDGTTQRADDVRWLPTPLPQVANLVVDDGNEDGVDERGEVGSPGRVREGPDVDTGRARPVEIHGAERGDEGVLDPAVAGHVTEVERVIVERTTGRPLLRATLTVLRLGRSAFLVPHAHAYLDLHPGPQWTAIHPPAQCRMARSSVCVRKPR